MCPTQGHTTVNGTTGTQPRQFGSEPGLLPFRKAEEQKINFVANNKAVPIHQSSASPSVVPD